MGRMENGVYIIQGEVNLVVTAMRRNSRWLTSHNHQDDENEPLLTSFSQLKDVLCNIADLGEITPNEFLSPFLSVIRSENTTGPVTGLALTSINKFLSYGLIESNNDLAAIATENIADAVTHARFVGTDPASDEVVLMKILHVLRTLMLTSTGSLLSNESVCEIMQSCFRICFEMRLSELLRKSAEHTLVDMVQLLFSRLPQFKEDAKLTTSLRKQLKMRTGGATDPSRSKVRKKPSKTAAKSLKKSLEASDQTTVQSELESAADNHSANDEGNVCQSSEHIESGAADADHDESVTACRQIEPPDSLAIEPMHSDITATTLTYDVSAMATTPVSCTGLVVDMGDELQESVETDNPASTDNAIISETCVPTDTDSQYIWNAVAEAALVAEKNAEQSTEPASIVTDGDVSHVIGSTVVVNHLDAESNEYVNTQGVRFTTQAASISASQEAATGPPIPYSLPCVRELLRFLVSLINPYDQHNTDVMIHMGLSLLTVALESGADYIGSFRSLLALVKDDLSKNAIFLLKSERLSLFAAAIRVCFLLFESMRGHLKLQLEMYLLKLMEIIVSESNRVSYEQREIALECVVQLLRIPGLVTELYLNYDCDLYCSSLFEDLMKLLSKNAFPVAGLYSTHLLSLDALLAVIDSIEQHCHHRILTTTMSSADANNIAAAEEEAKNIQDVCPPYPPASGYVMASKMTRDSQDWSQMNKSEILDFAKTKDEIRIRPNRMKVSCVVPTEEELSARKRKKKIYQNGTEQFNVKPVKGITFLQEHDLLSTPLDPKEVVAFLKENPKLDKKQIGEFLSNKKYSNVLEAYQKSFNFEGTRIDEALRMYLESFRLPGEAPVISYILEQFADHWHKTNGEPFANADAAFTLSYAVIMLNVDQHNVNAKKQSIPMTVENFKRNVSKVNGGKDFDPDMLDELYNAIRNDEIIMPAEQVGLVRDNYLWKVLLKRSVTKEGDYSHVPTGSFDRDLFAIVWGPTVAALSFVFDKSSDEMIIQKAVSGFRKCAMISAHYGMSDVFDNLVISLCKFTTLLTSIDSVESIPIFFGNNAKAQLAARTVFGLAHRHSDILHDGWKNILDCMLQLYRAKLLAEILVTVEDFLDPNGRISLIREEAVSPQRTESGVLSSFYSYFTLTDTPQQRGPTAEDQEAIRRAQNCIQECHVEQLIMESKFLRVDSLQELLKAMIYASRCPDSHENIHAASCEDDVAVFFLELLIKVVLQNRDRMGSYWQSIQDHLYSLIVNATEHSFLVERAVIGLLRLTIRFLRRDEIASQVLDSLRMLLMMKPEVIHSISHHISYGLHDMLKTNAANIHSAHDWFTLFTLLEVVGAGINPSPVMQCRSGADGNASQVLSDAAGAVSDSELPVAGKPTTSPADNSSDRGYTSDSELYDSHSAAESSSTIHKTPSTHGSWMMLYRDDIDGSSSLRPFNQYSLVLCSNEDCRAMLNHDTRSLMKCCETLAFLVRDAAHITPHNFTSCVHTIRTFVEASVDGGVRVSHRMSSGGANSKKTKHSKKQAMKTSRSSPSHLSTAASAAVDDDDRDADSYQTVSIQLLDLMHTLHTKAAAIYNSWAQDPAVPDITEVPVEDQQQIIDRSSIMGLPEDNESGTSALWTHCWCPLLQGIARSCSDSRRGVRSQALTYLQRALLMHDLQTLTAVEWENCFNKVLFPLLSKLLERINPQDPSGIEETRMRASTLLCKVFLQHLSPLLTLSTFTALWLTILEFMDKYMHADRSDLLSEAIPESLKNMLLVMHTAGILQHNTADSDNSKLWKLTWDRIDAFLPTLREEVFKPHDSDYRHHSRHQAVQLDTGVVSTSTAATDDVQTQQPMSSSHGHSASSQCPPASTAVTSSADSKLSANDQSITTATSLPPDCSPANDNTSRTQYVLHPPVPAISSNNSSTPADQLASIPLLLNPDILQSSNIPVITPQNSSGER